MAISRSNWIILAVCLVLLVTIIAVGWQPARAPVAPSQRSPSVSLTPMNAVAPTSSPSASPSPSPSSAPTPSPTPSAELTVRATEEPIGHSTSPNMVLLRMSQTPGGLNPGPGTQPVFTLFGDGSVVVRRQVDGVSQDPETRRLSPDEVQDLLAFALGPGGLRVARDLYPYVSFGAIPSTFIEVRVEGLHKVVKLQLPLGNLLLAEDPELEGLQRLALRLNTFTT